MATNWQIGDRIQNRWEIYKILKGGMGIVYVVYDHRFREAFAAKTFQDEVFAGNPQIADRFTQEAIAWINLDIHQNITQARFVENIEGKPFLFLEYVSGGDLSGWIGTPRLTEDLPQVLRFAIHFCDGMTHALSKGIKAHRDIKPQNSLITEDGTLKVTDFGLARVMAIEEGEGGRAGTPEYMPPEQWDNFEQADERSDIYSFGAMLYEMLSGQPPFEGRRSKISTRELERRHKQTSPPPLTSHELQLANLVHTCLLKDPTCRFTDFAVVRRQLAEIYERLTAEPAPEPLAGPELHAAHWDIKGVSLVNLGLKNQALVCYNRAIEMSRNYPYAWSNKGVVLNELGRNEEAVACYDQAIEISPHDERTWSNKANALHALGQDDDALGCCERAIALNPRYHGAWANKGNTLRGLGHAEEAVTCYERALELLPDCAEVWHNKGAALGEAGQVGDALVCFEQAERLGLPQAAQGIAMCRERLAAEWFTKGVASQVSGRWEEAFACYERALQLNPRFGRAWTNRGAVLSAVGLDEDAIPCYDQALEINAHDERAWYSKGATLANTGRFHQALECFEKAEQLGVVQAAEAIAMCRQKLGQR